jgi:hypothetical protein
MTNSANGTGPTCDFEVKPKPLYLQVSDTFTLRCDGTEPQTLSEVVTVSKFPT